MSLLFDLFDAGPVTVALIILLGLISPTALSRIAIVTPPCWPPAIRSSLDAGRE